MSASSKALLPLCYATELLFGLCMGIWSIAFGFHLSFLGFGDAAIGQMLSYGYLVTAVVAFFVGRLGDVIGFPCVAALGALCSGASLVMLSLSHSMPAACCSRILYSAGYACIMSMEFTLPVSLAPPEQKLPIYNRILLLYQTGSIIGSLLCGWGADALRRYVSNPYALLCALAGVLYLIISAIRARLPRQATTVVAEKRGPKAYFSCLKDPKVLSFLLFGALTLGLFALTTSCLNLVLRYRFDASDSVVGTALSAFALAGCLALAVLPVLSRRFTLHRISVVALAVQAVVILALTRSNLSVFIVLFIVRTVTCNILYTSVDGPMLRAMSENQQGIYSGMRIFANNAGMSLALLVTGVLIDARYFVPLFLLSAAVALSQNLVYHGLCVRYLRQ